MRSTVATTQNVISALTRANSSHTLPPCETLHPSLLRRTAAVCLPEFFTSPLNSGRCLLLRLIDSPELGVDNFPTTLVWIRVGRASNDVGTGQSEILSTNANTCVYLRCEGGDTFISMTSYCKTCASSRRR
ncbi:hypothetical protein AAHA92_23008 [Salvia divinorum]|uniref:Uncharacterized protein n=1 Tax=Salvia divinorum TaxID=28513 RepID=A0ABD1GTE8_SALDI